MTEGTQMNKHIGRALVVLAGTMLTGALLTVPASAQVDPAFEHGYPNVTAVATDKCGEIELVFTNPTPWLFVFDVRVDGEGAINASVAPGVEIKEGPLAGQEFGPRWRLVTVDGSNGVHEVTETFEFTSSVEVRLAEGAEQKLYFDWRSIDVSEVDECPEPSPSPSPSTPADDDDDDVDDVDDGKDDDAGTGGGGADDNDTLPVTGAPAALIAGAGAALLGAGLVLWWAMKRRTPKFDV